MTIKTAYELFKMFTVEKHDQKQLYQSYFMDYDWIWKVLVYGNILDFYLVERLKSNNTIKEIDKEIYSIYKINNQEQALIDYAHEISIPLIKRRDKQRFFEFNEIKKKRKAACVILGELMLP